MQKRPAQFGLDAVGKGIEVSQVADGREDSGPVGADLHVLLDIDRGLLICQASGPEQQDKRGDARLCGNGGHGRANVAGGQAGQAARSLFQSDTGRHANRAVLERTGGIRPLHLHQEPEALDGLSNARERDEPCPTRTKFNAERGINDRQQFAIAP